MMPESDSEGDEAVEWKPLGWTWCGVNGITREDKVMAEQAVMINGATRSDDVGDKVQMDAEGDDAAQFDTRLASTGSRAAST